MQPSDTTSRHDADSQGDDSDSRDGRASSRGDDADGSADDNGGDAARDSVCCDDDIELPSGQRAAHPSAGWPAGSAAGLGRLPPDRKT